MRRTEQARVPGRRQSPPRWHDRVVAFLAGTVFILMALEAALRVTGHFYRTPPGNLSDEMVPCPGCTRILCAGDSFTYGIGASAGHDYPSQLARLLNGSTSVLESQDSSRDDRPTSGDTAEGHPAQAVQVRNAGMPARNTSGLLSALPAELVSFQPQVVIVLIGTNNEIDYRGYNAYLDRQTLSSRVTAALQRIRVIRLATFFANRIRQKYRKKSRDTLLLGGRGKTPGGMVDTYLRWHRRKHPDNPIPPPLPAALSALAQGRRVEAQSLLEQAAGDHPNGAEVYWALGEVFQSALNVDEAERWYHRAIDADPSDPLACYSLGRLKLDQENDPDGAMTWFKRGIKADPRFGSNFAAAGLVTWVYQHDPEHAIDLMKQCVKADPDNPDCYPDLTALARDLGQATAIAQFIGRYASTSEVASDYLSMLATGASEERIKAWTRSDLHSILERVIQAGAIPLLLTYPDDDPVNAIIGEVAHDAGCAFVPLDRVFHDRLRDGTPREALFVPDGHCNDQGYALMAHELARTLLEQGLIPHDNRESFSGTRTTR